MEQQLGYTEWVDRGEWVNSVSAGSAEIRGSDDEQNAPAREFA